MKRIVFLLLAFVGVAVGLGFVMPAVAQWRNEGAMTWLSVGLFILGLGLTAGGLAAGTAGVRRVPS